MLYRLPLLLLLFAAILGDLVAQPKRLSPSIRNPSQLNTTEGERVISQFRDFNVVGDFVFSITLVHEPHRGDSFSYDGILSGYASPSLRTRIELFPDGASEATLKYLQWSRPAPALSKIDLREEDPSVEDVLKENLFEPLLPGLAISPFDLMMPFLDWPDYAYEGTRRFRGREVHFFLLYPPSDDPAAQSIGGVRVAIDADFNVAVRTETIDPEGETLRRLDVRSVKKVDEQWIIRRLDLVDLETRDRTRLVVNAARVGIALEPSLFTPEGLILPFPEVDLKEL